MHNTEIEKQKEPTLATAFEMLISAIAFSKAYETAFDCLGLSEQAPERLEEAADSLLQNHAAMSRLSKALLSVSDSEEKLLEALGECLGESAKPVTEPAAYALRFIRNAVQKRPFTCCSESPGIVDEKKDDAINSQHDLAKSIASLSPSPCPDNPAYSMPSRLPFKTIRDYETNSVEMPELASEFPVLPWPGKDFSQSEIADTIRSWLPALLSRMPENIVNEFSDLGTLAPLTVALCFELMQSPTFLSTAEIANSTGIDPKSIRSSLKRLVALGYIDYIRYGGGNKFIWVGSMQPAIACKSLNEAPGQEIVFRPVIKWPPETMSWGRPKYQRISLGAISQLGSLSSEDQKDITEAWEKGKISQVALGLAVELAAHGDYLRLEDFSLATGMTPMKTRGALYELKQAGLADEIPVIGSRRKLMLWKP